MQTKPFQIYFSEKHYKQLYDETDCQWILQNDEKQIYSVKKRGEQNKTFIAKKYIYQQEDFIDEVWEEVNSVIKMKNQLHPNIIKYESIFMYDTQENDINYQICIMIMEKGEQTLEEFLESTLNKDQQQLQIFEDSGKTLKKNQKANQQQQQQDYENIVYQYLKQTLSGFQYLQSLNIHHRDYKPTNIVLINNQVKIIDFDIAKITHFDFTQQMSAIKGTKIYMDPNLISICEQMYQLDDEEDQEIQYNLQKTEIYSIGCTFLQLAMKWNIQLYKKYYNLTKQHFNKKKYKEQETHLQKVTSQIQHKKLKQILCKILVVDLKKRWDLEKCIKLLDFDQDQNQNQNKIQKQSQQKDNHKVNNSNYNINFVSKYNSNFNFKQNKYIKNPNQIQQNIKKYRQFHQNFLKKVKEQQQQKQIEQINYSDYGTNNLEQITYEFEQLDKEKFTIYLKDDHMISKEQVRQTRYLDIQVQQEIKKVSQQQSNLISIFKNQAELIKLDINMNHISPDLINQLFSKISYCKNIIQLSIQIGDWNKIREVEANIIGQAIEKLESLQQLYISIGKNNKIGQQGTKQILSAIGKLTSLQDLQLIIQDDNDIKEQGAKNIGSALEKVTNLQKLHLIIGWDNNIGQEGAKSIGSALKKLTSLKELYLTIESNNIGQQGAKSIGFGLYKLSSLEKLHLTIGWDNNIGEEGAKGLGQTLQCLQSLQELHLVIGFWNINEQGAKIIGSAIQTLKTLKNLHITIDQENYIGIEGAQSIGFSVLELHNLSEIYLMMNGEKYCSIQELQKLFDYFSQSV